MDSWHSHICYIYYIYYIRYANMAMPGIRWRSTCVQLDQRKAQRCVVGQLAGKYLHCGSVH